jgi:photosystem II stability/assembly factor-like uncharacterized protein
MVDLYCSPSPGVLGIYKTTTATDAQGWYGLSVGQTACDYYDIVVRTPYGYTAKGATTVDGNVITATWIEYATPLQGKTLTGNKFWFQALSQPTAPTWSNAGLYGGRAGSYLAEPLSGTLYANVGLTNNRLWVSTNHGNTWAELAENAHLVGADGGTIVAVRSAPSGSELLLFSPTGTVTRSVAFESFRPYAAGQGVIYLGTHYPDHSFPLTLRRSTDHGVTWVTATLPYTITFAGPPTQPVLLPDPAAPATRVYLSNQGGAPAEGIWRGVWNGSDFDWTKVFTNTQIASVNVNPHYTVTRQIWANLGDQSPYRIEDDGINPPTATQIISLTSAFGDRVDFHPVSPTVVYIGSWVTGDNGNTWTQWNNPFSWGGFPLVFDPSDATHNTMWIGSNAGLWRTTNAGITWTQRSQGIEAVDVYDIEQNPVDARVVYAATDGGLWRTLNFDNPLTPTWELVDPQDVNIGVYDTLLNDPHDTATIYAAREGSDRVRKADYGETSTLSDTAPLGTPLYLPGLAADPNTADTIFAAGYAFSDTGTSTQLVGGLYGSNDGGDNWAQLLQKPAFAVLAVDHRLFVGIYSASGYGLVSTTLPLAGTPVAWTPVAPSVITTTVIAIDRYSNTMLIGAGIDESIKGSAGERWQMPSLNQKGRVYVSYDSGATWLDITPPPPSDPNLGTPPFRAVSIDPLDTQHLTVVGRGMAYESTDGGQHWSDLSATGPLWGSVFDIGYMAPCPLAVTGLTGTVSSNVVTLTWIAPVDYAGAMVRVATDTYPTLSTMGTLVTETVSTSAVYGGLGSGTSYFGVFARSPDGHVCRSAQLKVTGSQVTPLLSELSELPSARVRPASAPSVTFSPLNVLASSGGIYRTAPASQGQSVGLLFLPVVQR